MAATKTLLQLRNAVIQGAAIDNQTGSTGRHPSATIDELINRYIESVYSIVGDEGGPHLQAVGAITALPAATTNEDFIEIAWPTTAEEVLGVDVLSTQTGTETARWSGLDPADWSQRRELNLGRSYPPGGVGWWAVKEMPKAAASASVTAGTVALFPADLTGSYRVTYLEQWTDMTSDTHVWVCHADFATWVINSCVMALTKRDTLKKANYAAAEKEMARAEDRIRAAAGRAGPGKVTPTRSGGEWF